MSAKNGLIYRTLGDNDCGDVVKFLQKHFIPAEPLLVMAGVKAEEEKAFPYLIIKNTLWQKASIGVYDSENGHLCALRISMFGKNEDSLPVDDREELHSPKQQSVHRILHAVKGDDFDQYLGTVNYMNHEFVCVDKAYMRRGIATELFKQSEILALDHGCRKMVATCSNHFTRRSVEKFGYKLAKEIMYDDYIDALTGDKPFIGISPPHKSIAVMVKTLPVQRSIL